MAAQRQTPQIDRLGKADAQQAARAPNDARVMRTAVTDVDEPSLARRHHAGRHDDARAKLGEITDGAFNSDRRMFENEDPAKKGSWAAYATPVA